MRWFYKSCANVSPFITRLWTPNLSDSRRVGTTSVRIAWNVRGILNFLVDFRIHPSYTKHVSENRRDNRFSSSGETTIEHVDTETEIDEPRDVRNFVVYFFRSRNKKYWVSLCDLARCRAYKTLTYFFLYACIILDTKTQRSYLPLRPSTENSHRVVSFPRCFRWIYSDVSHNPHPVYQSTTLGDSYLAKSIFFFFLQPSCTRINANVSFENHFLQIGSDGTYHHDHSIILSWNIPCFRL